MTDPLEEAVYLYGVAPVAYAGVLPTGDGAIDPRFPLELVLEGDLVALTSGISPAHFAGIMDRGRGDLGSLEQLVRTHRDVLARADRAAALIPSRFGTILADRSALRELLRASALELEAQLELLAGAREWGVKALLVREGLEAAVIVDEPALERLRDEAASGKGSAFFARKRLEQVVQARLLDAAAAIAETAHDRFSACARRAVANPPQPRELSHYDEEMILNGAYLVEREREDALRVAIDELVERYGGCARFELTGPWPAFNFVDRELVSTP